MKSHTVCFGRAFEEAARQETAPVGCMKPVPMAWEESNLPAASHEVVEQSKQAAGPKRKSMFKRNPSALRPWRFGDESPTTFCVSEETVEQQKGGNVFTFLQ
jgi:hypothetical protein